jgi:chloride channel protein, CIC family
MSSHEIENASTTEGLPVSPSLQPTLDAADVPMQLALVDQRVLMICALCVLLAVAAALVARALVHLIALITNISFYGRFALAEVTPWQHRLGAWVIGIPAVGGLIVGLTARYGSTAIRGHGIPEAMEQILTRQSRIPPVVEPHGLRRPRPSRVGMP